MIPEKNLSDKHAKRILALFDSRIRALETVDKESETELVHRIQNLQDRIWTLEKEHGKHN